MGGQLPAITPRLVGRIALLALAYVAFGRLGLALDAVSGFATLVWAPTGIALAALLLGGTRLWPGVALGALIVNLWAGAPLAVACGIAVGNTLEAVLGTLALRRIRGFRASLDRIQDAIGFIVLAACLSPLASATIGVTSLLLGGVIEREAFGVTWGAWWVGDAIGALVVAPLMLSWASARRRKWPRERLLELGLMSVAVVAVALFIFRGVVRGEALAFLQPYLLAPVMLWAALRFDTRITTGAVFVISVVAVWGTAAGLGPFHGGDLVGAPALAPGVHQPARTHAARSRRGGRRPATRREGAARRSRPGPGREPRQEPLPRHHEPRAAHPAHRHHGLRRAHAGEHRR